MEKTPENVGLSEETTLESPSVKSSGKARQPAAKKLPLIKKVKPEKADSSAFTSDVEGVLDPKELLRILLEVKNGNFNVRMPIDKYGIDGKICDTLNDIISINKKLTQEFTKAQISIGKEGKLNQRINLSGAQGDWSTGVEALNALISDLAYPIR
jgi:hypothetical protein